MTKEEKIALVCDRIGEQGVLQKVLLDLFDDSSIRSLYLQMPGFVKHSDWLYEATYNNIDYAFAEEQIDERYLPRTGCTAVCNGNFLGGNFDWTYNNDITLVCRTAASEERYATLGICGAVPELTRALAESGSYSDAYRLAPFYIVDGINSEGLACKENMLTREESKGITTGTVPAVEERDRICMLMLPRYILDHYASVSEAIEGLRDYVSIYAPQGELFSDELHFMLADGTSTVILEFVNNELVYTEVGDSEDYPAVMANFYANGVTANADGTITRNTSSDPDAENANGVTPFGQGVERHNIAVAGLVNADDGDGMKALMRDLFYSQAYTLTSDQWYTEFLGNWSEELGGRLVVTTPSDNFSAILSVASEKYENRSREKDSPYYGTWHTTHSVVYDITNTKLSVCVQEGDEYVDFTL